ncbi:heterokaryon incompatibility protein-domain-containing protein [Immersiella caudata]|uniref:Heterokaryon incompatibility protein-domain-containing protein n=1 Tax=Immersiella caudata TaxID=314043 RepID=A0AA39X5Z1_9PEZI|nr:heterokaryon incompatibility protein-domain-containing protein [Immersiella caudata]
MRLLHADTLEPREFLDDHTPPYAILSHTWGDDAEELTLQDILAGEPYKPGIGIEKLHGTRALAKAQGLDWVWIDTCCIDKTNLVELSEAINSMCRWYQQAAVCYAYLWDVPGGINAHSSQEFRNSRWFRRGWTLQELIAPRRVVFYSTDWTRLGTKAQIASVIEDITRIPYAFLRGIADVRSASIAQRMSWAAKRETKRKEDTAYCLLGLFGITMPMIYGEGGEQAFFRLQEQIMKTTRDQSILAWGLVPIPSGNDPPPRPSQSLGFLAANPSEFANSGDIVTNDTSSSYLDLLEIHGGDLRASVSLLGCGEGQSVDLFALLNCKPQRNPSYVVGIPLKKVATPGPDGGSHQYLRPRGSHARLRSTLKLSVIEGRSTVHIRNDDPQSRQVQGTGRRQCAFVYDEDDMADLNLDIIEVLPQSAWDKERAIVTCEAPEYRLDPFIPGGISQRLQQQLLNPSAPYPPLLRGNPPATSPNPLHLPKPTHVRLRHKAHTGQNSNGTPADFHLTLWFKQRFPLSDYIEPAYAVDTIDRATKALAELMEQPFDATQNKKLADNGHLKLGFDFSNVEGSHGFYILVPNTGEPSQETLDRKREALQRAMNRTVINGGNSFKLAAGA